MPVKTYMDGSLLAAGHTLIRCTLTGENAAAPSVAGRMQLTEAGSGSIITQHVRKLTLEDGYIRLNRACIAADRELETVELPASVKEISPGFLRGSSVREILLRQYADEHTADLLKASSFRLKYGEFLFLPALSGPHVLENISAAAAVLAPPLPFLNSDMRILFLWNDSVSIVNPRPCYDLTGRAAEMDEYTAVMNMIRDGVTGWRHPEADRQSDNRIRVNAAGGSHTEESIARYSLSPAQPDGQPRLTVRLTRNKLFTPQLLPIRWQERQYYLYSRNHLTRDRECPYWREDVCVFDAEGLVTDRTISEAVYAKARLLIFL